MKVGILALQGNFASHAKLVEQIGAQPHFVKTSEQLAEVDGLIIPGGESTTLTKLLEESNLRQAIVDFAKSGRKILGTCAGLIMLAKRLGKPDELVRPLELIDITVERNAYGPQIHSKFETIQLEETNNNKALTDKVCFIRAPQIIEIGKDVQVLARINGQPCAVRQANLIALTFHPELTEIDYFHRLAFN